MDSKEEIAEVEKSPNDVKHVEISKKYDNKGEEEEDIDVILDEDDDEKENDEELLPGDKEFLRISFLRFRLGVVISLTGLLFWRLKEDGFKVKV